jgi:WD40 repeat protein
MHANQQNYQLRRVSQDGQGPLLLRPLAAVPGHPFPRREFLAAGMSFAAALAQTGQTAGAEKLAIAGADVPRVVFAHTKRVSALQFAAGGSLLVSGSWDGTAKVWRMATGELARTFGDRASPINAVAIAPDSTRLFAATAGHRVLVWTLPAGKPCLTFEKHGAPVRALALSHDGRFAASGADNGKTLLWAAKDGTVFDSIAGGGKAVKKLALAPDSSTLYVGTGRKLQAYSLPGAALKREVEGHRPWVLALAASPDGQHVASGGSSGDVMLRRASDLRAIGEFKEHRGWVNEVVYTPDSSLLITVSNDCVARLGSVPSGGLSGEIRGPFPFTSAAVSPDNQVLATGDTHGVICLWDLRRQEIRSFLFDPTASSVDAVVYHVVDLVTQRPLYYTVPRGTPVPPQATCACNFVAGQLTQVATRIQEAKAHRRQSAEELATVDRKEALRIRREKQNAVANERAQGIQQMMALRLQQQMLARQYYYNLMTQRAMSSGGSSGSRTVCTCNTISRT